MKHSKQQQQLRLPTRNPFLVGAHVWLSQTNEYLGKIVKLDDSFKGTDWFFACLDNDDWIMSDDIEDGTLVMSKPKDSGDIPKEITVKCPFFVGQRLFNNNTKRPVQGYMGVVARAYPAHVSKGVWFAVTSGGFHASSDELLTRTVTVGNRTTAATTSCK